MPEEGELVSSLGSDIHRQEHDINQPEGIVAKIQEYTKNIDALHFGINSKTGDERTINMITSYVQEHVDDMLELCLGENDEFSSQALRNIYVTLLCAHLSDNEPLRSKVGEYFSKDEERLEALVTSKAADKSLPVFASLYYWADDATKDEFEEILSRNIEVCDGFLKKGDLQFVLTFLESFATRKSSHHSEQFKSYLKDSIDTITRHISVEDMARSELIFNIAYKLYVSDDEAVSRKYYDVLAENLQVLLKGFRDGKFSSELQRLLNSNTNGELKGTIINSLTTEYKSFEIETKRAVYEMFSSSLLIDQPSDVRDKLVDFFNANADSIIADIFHNNGKHYYLDTLFRVCSDDVVDKIFMELDGQLEKEKDASANAYLFNIINTSVVERSGSIRRALPLYQKHMQKLQDVMFDPFLIEKLKGWKIDVYKKAVSNAALYGSGEVSNLAIEIVCHTLQFDLKTFFQQYGLEADVFIDAWRQGLGDVFENFSSNKYIVEKLIAERGPDIVKTLSEQFGIKNFSRYPVEMLIQQYDERGVKDKRYGVMLFSTFDHGRAFNSEEDRLVMTSIKDQLGKDILVRFAEAGSRYELAKRFSQLHRRYGRMSFGLIGAHGQDNMFQLGLGGERKELSVDDLLGEEASKARRFFDEGATLILESCSTGADEGIAEQLSERLGMNVVAPKEDSGGIQNIRVKTSDDDPPEFDVNFWYTKGRVYQKGSLVSESSAIEDDIL